MADFLITLAVVLGWAWVANRFIRRFDPDERRLLWVSFLAHQVAAFVNIAVTKFYYMWGDMMSYYRFGVVAAERLNQDFWSLAPGLFGLITHRTEPLPVPLPMEAFPGATGAMQGASAFGMYLFFDSLYAVCAFIAGAAFVSKLGLYKIVREELSDLPKVPVLLICTLLPSALFWSTSLLKEPLAMLGLLSALYGWHQLLTGRRVLRAVALVVSGGLVVVAFKGYILPPLALAAIAWHVVRKLRDARGDVTFTAGHVVLASVVGLLLIAATGVLLPQFGADALGEQLAGLQTIGATGDGTSNYSLGATAGSPAAQAALAPLGLLTALFRPVIFEVKTPIVLINALEMLLFQLGTVLVVIRRGVLASFSELFRRPFLSFCAVFVLIFGTCVGLGTTNLGSLSRYRMPLTPFFGALLLALIARAPVSIIVGRLSRRQTVVERLS